MGLKSGQSGLSMRGLAEYHDRKILKIWQNKNEADPERGADLGAALGAADLKEDPPALPPDLAARASPGTAAEASRMDAARVAAAIPAHLSTQ